jgi:hypothetical protein
MITDQDLITAAHPATRSARHYLATYFDGRTVSFAAASLNHATALANEYGVRWLGGVRVANVHWLRP